jgi:glycine/D-amino acid oxidase-like deaminating enzyme
VQAIYPLFNLVECVGATFGPKDGTMSPLDVLLAYRRKAISLGATVLEAEVSALLKEDRHIGGVRLTSGEILTAPAVVNTAGAWAAKLTQTVGIDLPLKAIKRQVYSIETPVHFERILPALLLPSGQYCFHEGEGHFTTGGARPDDPETFADFSWSRERFEAHLWEGLVKYLPAFDRLKVVKGWAGLYAVNTFDGNAILGEWPELPGLFLANGFSGHGFQQCHAVGRYLAELILDQPSTLDLSIFSPRRILANKPVFENPRKII